MATSIRWAWLANVVASVEAALGLMGFALATGLLYARFSRPNAQLVFSDHMVVAPYGDGHSLQFRMANRRTNVLTDVQVDMMLMTVEQDARRATSPEFCGAEAGAEEDVLPGAHLDRGSPYR